MAKGAESALIERHVILKIIVSKLVSVKQPGLECNVRGVYVPCEGPPKGVSALELYGYQAEITNDE